MKTSKFFTLKETRLNNNCPECFSNDGLQLTFKQKFTENAFYKAITNEVSHEMYCNICNMAIFPVRWTEDIERVVAYQQRAVSPKAKFVKLKPLAWGLMLAGIIISAVIILVATGSITF